MTPVSVDQLTPREVQALAAGIADLLGTPAPPAPRGRVREPRRRTARVAA